MLEIFETFPIASLRLHFMGSLKSFASWTSAFYLLKFCCFCFFFFHFPCAGGFMPRMGTQFIIVWVKFPEGTKLDVCVQSAADSVFQRWSQQYFQSLMLFFQCDYDISFRRLVLFSLLLNFDDYGGNGALWLQKLGHEGLMSFCWLLRDTCPWHLAIILWPEHSKKRGE